MIIFILRLIVPLEKKADIIRMLDLIIGPTEAKPGCLNCRLYNNHWLEEELLLIEEWESQTKFEQHLCSDEFKKTLETMDMASKKPHLAFHTISNTEGIEMVKRLMSKKAAAWNRN